MHYFLKLVREGQATTLKSLDALSLPWYCPCPRATPYDWQVDLADAPTLGLDATVIAGTGLKEPCPGRCL